MLLIESSGTPVDPGAPDDSDLLVNTPSLAPYLAQQLLQWGGLPWVGYYVTAAAVTPTPTPTPTPTSSGGGGGAMELGWLIGWLASVIGVWVVTPRRKRHEDRKSTPAGTADPTQPDR